MIKRLFTTSVLTFGRTSSSASMVSDSVPVCWMERLPTPCSSTSSKPLALLDSLVTLLESSVVSLGSSWIVPAEEEVTCEEDELTCPLDPTMKRQKRRYSRFRR